MSADNFFQWCKELHKTTYAKRWRSLVVLSGESDWQKNIIESGFSRYCEYISQIETPLKGLLYDESNGFVIPQHQELLFQNVNHKNYVQHLGTEQNIIIFSATTAFDANAFAA
jgi:tRNA(Met) cytidine acetyltransferase